MINLCLASYANSMMSSVKDISETLKHMHYQVPDSKHSSQRLDIRNYFINEFYKTNFSGIP
jgi:hypothetical protein